VTSMSSSAVTTSKKRKGEAVDRHLRTAHAEDVRRAPFSRRRGVVEGRKHKPVIPHQPAATHPTPKRSHPTHPSQPIMPYMPVSY
jgi:hypothetical protein